MPLMCVLEGIVIAPDAHRLTAAQGSGSERERERESERESPRRYSTNSRTPNAWGGGGRKRDANRTSCYASEFVRTRVCATIPNLIATALMCVWQLSEAVLLQTAESIRTQASNGQCLFIRRPVWEAMSQNTHTHTPHREGVSGLIPLLCPIVAEDCWYNS